MKRALVPLARPAAAQGPARAGTWLDWGRFLLSRYLVASSIPLVIAHVASALVGLGRNVLLTHALPKADYGSLSYLMNAVSLVTLAGLSGLDVAVAQVVAKGHWEAIRLGLRRRLVLSLLPVALLVALALGSGRFGAVALAPGVWLLTALFFPSAQVLALINSVLGALKRFRAAALYSVGQSLAFLCAAALGLALSPAQPLLAIVGLQWLFLSLLNAVFWLRLGRPEAPQAPLPPEGRRRLYRFGLTMTLLSGMGQAGARLGTLLLGSVVSLDALADYTVAELFFEQLRALWNIYYSVSYPRIIGLSPPARWRQVRRELRLVTPLFAALCAVAGLALSAVIPFLFSVRYGASIAYLWVLLLAFICSVPGGFFEMYFRLEEAGRSLLAIRAASNLSAIVLPPLLLLVYGPLGLPLGRAVANLIFSLSGLLLYYRRRPPSGQAGAGVPEPSREETTAVPAPSGSDPAAAADEAQPRTR